MNAGTRQIESSSGSATTSASTARWTTSYGRTLLVKTVVFAVLLVIQRPVTDAFYRAMTVLVVASPCALVLSIPSAILVAIAAGARRNRTGGAQSGRRAG